MNSKRIIKFIILVAIFYALLACNVFDIGEKIAPSSKDYTQIETLSGEEYQQNSLIEENNISTTGHFATDTKYDLDTLCGSIEICEKIDFNGTFTDEEKYSYTKIISKIVQFIDSYGTQNADIKEVITDIDINKENGQRRGYATRDTIVFNLGSVSSQKEFSELSTHEMGHITDLGYIQ